MCFNVEERLSGLTGQVAVVTGGGRGLGRAFASALAMAGATVAVVSRSANQLAETVAIINRTGGHAMAFTVDVTDSHAVTRMISEVEQRLGAVNLLVNNAGTAGPLGPIWEIDPKEWWHCMEINMYGSFLCSRAVMPGMMARHRGRIINVSSGASTVAIPYLSAYVTSKTALTRFTEILARETKEYGISIFAIEPGTVRTAMAEYALKSPEGQKWMPWFKTIFDEGQDVSPEYAAQLVLLLASGTADELSGRFINRSDDVAVLLERAEEIKRDGLYTLRLRQGTRQE